MKRGKKRKTGNRHWVTGESILVLSDTVFKMKLIIGVQKLGDKMVGLIRELQTVQ